MKQLLKTGRLFYGIGIAAIGVHQIIIKQFRDEILPPSPSWLHQSPIFLFIVSIALIFPGIIISGLITIRILNTKNLCLYLGFSFFVLFIFCHLPYILIFGPVKASRIDTWFGAGEELAYCGGAFVMAASFPKNMLGNDRKSSFILLLEKFIPAGRIFYSLLIILFGSTHFIFTDVVSAMIPKWFGNPLFWTYLAGALLIAAGVAIIFRICIKTVALLLAILLFLFFVFFHIPDAIANPFTNGGNEIVRAIIALLFCGIALVITFNYDNKKVIETDK